MSPMKYIRTWKQFFFTLLKPGFPMVRDIGAWLGIVKQDPFRQRFHLGYLKEGTDIALFVAHLRTHKFIYQRMAWIDPDEVLGMRKLDEFHPTWQYHVRVYKDGEVRGHYEKTPEDFPMDHLHEVGLEDRTKEFYGFFDGFVEFRSTGEAQDLNQGR